MPQAARAAHGESAPRRTVTVTGRAEGPRRHLHPVAPGSALERAVAAPTRASRVIQIERRRPPRPAQERLGSQPDRLAMWALLMALALIVVVAATSSHP